MIRPSTQSRARAFTLIELLVVVAIISLLISILLPSLGKARKYARSAACSANLHGIGQSMSIYASDWNDAIIGGPTTTGCFLYKNGYDPTLIAGDANGTYSDNNCPNIVRMDDWMSPILALTNGLITSAGDPTSRAQRFTQTTKTKSFICPDNQIPATQYTGSGVSLPAINTSFLMPSYSTAATFYWYPAGYGGGSFSNLETRGSTPGSGTLSAPGGYAPRVSRVGQPGRKIFMGDSARFCNTAATSSVPDVNLGFNFTATSGFNGYGFASGGACFTTDSGWCTDGDPLNSGAKTPYDPRLFAFRHGGGSLHSPGGSFKGNFLFFDGHAESLSDIDAGDPNFWMPSGTQWTPTAPSSSSSLKLQNSVKIKYFTSYYKDGKIQTPPNPINIQ